MTIEYRSGGELLKAANSDAENQKQNSTVIEPTTSHNYSQRPHVLQIKRPVTLKASLKGNKGETITDVKEIQSYPGKKSIIGYLT